MNRQIRNIVIGSVAFGIVVGVIAWLVRPSQPPQGGASEARQTPSVLTVEVVTPQVQTWPQSLSADGPLVAWQEIIVSPELGGLRIAELMVDVGEPVKRGQLLVRLAEESVQADLRKQQATVEQARVALEQAVSNMKRAKTVEGSGALSQQKIEEYAIAEETARAALAAAQAERDSIRLKLTQTRIVAPDDGIVASKSGVLGNVVAAGAELYRLVRQGRIEWRPELDARQLSAVRPGQTAHIILPSGERVEGKVRLVAPTLSTSSGRGTVFVSLPQDSSARVGMFASGTLEFDAKPALTLPQSAIVMRDGRSYAYMVGAGDKVSARPVEVGRRRADRAEVLSGLDAGARVVASGGAFLSEGAQVTVTSGGLSRGTP